ncbi:O-antigen ligase family protein [Clostridium perfringens]|uniref:O-antigen ligase family protein n=1 Tax=Clostridium perfringens TaxID=1502 RepID=UPI0018AC122F|nr:O-antigen ligase family protein [Clostridium perfringens]EJT5931351.1 O-antigen ligase family protein [Clostridium perfringens]EJT6162613.1 O-antigen ligase family protein [Clostridium perfringens]EJT6505099.1 O-antigen ligase family protein [Clostridium perfringens]HEF0383872.1 O-antigen ligase family protein [Clostridium perfringens]
MKINIYINIIYVISYYALPREYIAEGLTFNFSNPNLTGIFLLNSCLYSILGVIYFKGYYRNISLITTIYLIKFVIDTKSRTALISIIIFIIITFIIYFRKRVNLNKYFLDIILLTPFFIVYIYMYMVKSGLINILSFMQSKGKPLGSRFFIWEYAINKFKENPLFGNYFGISNGTGMSQMHNIYVDVLSSYGIIIFMLFSIYMIRIINSINKKCNSKFQNIALLAFLTMILMGTGEAALVSGGLGMYILTGNFLMLARYNSEI